MNKNIAINIDISGIGKSLQYRLNNFYTTYNLVECNEVMNMAYLLIPNRLKTLKIQVLLADDRKPLFII